MREPKRLQRRPHFRGMPIPANVIVDLVTGVPDFASIDHVVATKLAMERRCALCAEKMRGPVAFVGGEGSLASTLFTDGPMHKECARYAFFVCPFVSGDHRQYRESQKEHEGYAPMHKPMGLSKTMGLLLADDYGLFEGGVFEAVGKKQLLMDKEIKAAA